MNAMILSVIFIGVALAAGIAIMDFRRAKRKADFERSACRCSVCALFVDDVTTSVQPYLVLPASLIPHTVIQAKLDGFNIHDFLGSEAHEAKGKIVPVWFTQAQLEAIVLEAEKSGQTVSQWMRRALSAALEA
jgi:hypothetical protein